MILRGVLNTHASVISSSKYVPEDYSALLQDLLSAFAIPMMLVADADSWHALNVAPVKALVRTHHIAGPCTPCSYPSWKQCTFATRLLMTGAKHTAPAVLKVDDVPKRCPNVLRFGRLRILSSPTSKIQISITSHPEYSCLH